MHYETLLLDLTTISFKETEALNPATLLPDNNPTLPVHNCIEVIDHLTRLRPDLMDEPLSGAPSYFFDATLLKLVLGPYKIPICGPKPETLEYLYVGRIS